MSALAARTGLSRVTIFRLRPDRDSLIAESIGWEVFEFAALTLGSLLRGPL
jgi:hypothetical protein